MSQGKGISDEFIQDGLKVALIEVILPHLIETVVLAVVVTALLVVVVLLRHHQRCKAAHVTFFGAEKPPVKTLADIELMVRLQEQAKRNKQIRFWRRADG